MSEWDPDDMTAHLDYLRKLNQELIDNGELVEVQALAGPDLAKIVVFGGQGGPTRWVDRNSSAASARVTPSPRSAVIFRLAAAVMRFPSRARCTG